MFRNCSYLITLKCARTIQHPSSYHLHRVPSDEPSDSLHLWCREHFLCCGWPLPTNFLNYTRQIIPNCLSDLSENGISNIQTPLLSSLEPLSSHTSRQFGEKSRRTLEEGREKPNRGSQVANWLRIALLGTDDPHIPKMVTDRSRSCTSTDTSHHLQSNISARVKDEEVRRSTDQQPEGVSPLAESICTSFAGYRPLRGCRGWICETPRVQCQVYQSTN